MKKNKPSLLGYMILVCVGLAYTVSGLYSLQSGQRALILRFGKVVNEVADAGIHYHLPAPLERVVKFYVSEVQTIPIEDQGTVTVERFTGDENLIHVRAMISYDVNDLSKYLFTVQDVKSIVTSAGQNCLSQELAARTVDEVMTTGKSVLRLVLKDRIQNALDGLQTGVRVISVELTEIAPPADVAHAFKAVSDARIKKQRIIKDAEGYANVAIPEARGKASSIISQANAYAEEVLDFVDGRVSAFHDLLAEYQSNPEITTRLQYLETMQKIYKRSQVIIDTTLHTVFITLIKVSKNNLKIHRREGKKTRNF